MMKEHHITDALQAGVTAAVLTLPTPELRALPVKYIGRTFDKPNDGKWLEVVQLPNNIAGETWGDEMTYRGILRLLLHWPMDDAGAIPGLQVIGTITDFFDKGKMFAAGSVIVKITEIPELTGILETSPEIIFPVSIRYHCFDF